MEINESKLIENGNRNENRIEIGMNRGSLSLEASIVLSVFMMALISVISIMEMLKTYCDVEINLYKATKESALYISAKDCSEAISDNLVSDAVITVLADSYVKDTMTDQLNNNYQSVGLIKNGTSGMSYLHSRISTEDNNIFSDGDIIDMVVNYELEPLCNVFNVSPYQMVNRCRMHLWTGYERNEETNNEKERTVFVTENSSVYHLSRSCSHITLSITAVKYESLEQLRNGNGGKYKACEKCVSICPNDYSFVYITGEGDCYHSSLNCSGLKRTVKEIPISQTGGKRACSRCGSSN